MSGVRVQWMTVSRNFIKFANVLQNQSVGVLQASVYEKRYAAVLDNAIARRAREQANTTTATDGKQLMQPERWLLTQRDKAVEMTMLNENNHVYVRRAGMIPVVHGRAPNADLGLQPFPEFFNYT